MVQANTQLHQSLTQLYKSTSHDGREVAPPWDALDVEPRWRHRTNIYDANTPALTQVRVFSASPSAMCVCREGLLYLVVWASVWC